MKTIDIISAQAGQSVAIKTTPNNDILGYRISVDRWKGTPTTIDNWPGTDAEKGNGVSFDMPPADGYDITIKAIVKSDAQPKISVNLSITGHAPLVYKDVDFPSDEGPVVTRDWNIFLD